MKDIVNVAVVNFEAKWGDVAFNLSRIKGYIEAAAKRGADLVVFPELALTGYDYEKPLLGEVPMQHLKAENVPGKVTDELERLAKQYDLYVLVGLPEREENQFYNSVAILSPEGLEGTYRKIHLALDEPCWATAGDRPYLLDTPWGPIGICICYDVYSFPELIRYYAAKGARLIINSTAYAESRGSKKGNITLESAALVNGIYIATANLCGQDRQNTFWGGSSIIGPSRKVQDVYYYAGYPFGEDKGREQVLYMATIDLTVAKRGIYEKNLLTGKSDFKPNIYSKLYKELEKKR